MEQLSFASEHKFMC